MGTKLAKYVNSYKRASTCGEERNTDSRDIAEQRNWLGKSSGWELSSTVRFQQLCHLDIGDKKSILGMQAG
jgi:hypothetical protein